jgi:acyl-CoA reductase-like NAD-dependent aldehyde dehydrogenase
MILRKAGAALGAGCTMVVKPAHDTPYSCLALCDVNRKTNFFFDNFFFQLAKEAGFPDGTINVLTSTHSVAMGTFLCEHPLIKKVSFTGSSKIFKIF